MRRATTPTIKIDINTNLTGCEYRIAFKQRGVSTLVKTDKECILTNDGHTIEVPLTQRETLLFYANNKVMVQVRFSKDGKVGATNIVEIDMKAVLDEEIL